MEKTASTDDVENVHVRPFLPLLHDTAPEIGVSYRVHIGWDEDRNRITRQTLKRGRGGYFDVKGVVVMAFPINDRGMWTYDERGWTNVKSWGKVQNAPFEDRKS